MEKQILNTLKQDSSRSDDLYSS